MAAPDEKERWRQYVKQRFDGVDARLNRILQLLGDEQIIVELTQRLKASTDALEQAVDENK